MVGLTQCSVSIGPLLQLTLCSTLGCNFCHELGETLTPTWYELVIIYVKSSKWKRLDGVLN